MRGPEDRSSSACQARSTRTSSSSTRLPGWAPRSSKPRSPSTVTVSPAATRSPPATMPSARTSMAAAPTTAGIPHDRATTAAWLTIPPKVVTNPVASAIPATSAGEVSRRIRMTGSPRPARASVSSMSVQTTPTARPGDAAKPSARTSAALGAGGSGAGAVGGSASTSATRASAPARSRGKSGSSAMSMAARRAARGLRLPGRTCSSHNTPSSTVNSMSAMSPRSRSSRVAAAASSSAVSGQTLPISDSHRVACVPATTSSPCARGRNSPTRPGAPVLGSRLKATPVPDRSPRLPNVIAWTVTAVPKSSAMPSTRR